MVISRCGPGLRWHSGNRGGGCLACLSRLPAVALALLGLTAIRADDVEQQLRMREQQGQFARLADAALAAAFDRELTTAHATSDRDTSARAARGLPFAVDHRGVVWFPTDRVYAGDIHSDDPAYFQVVTDEQTVALTARAAAAMVQGRTLEAVALYEQLREVPQLRDWAEWQLALVRSSEAAGDLVIRYAGSTTFPLDARAPNGIPLAMIVASQSEALTTPARQRFASALERTLRELRSGRWWLTLDQRRAYDAELQRWLREARSDHDAGRDGRLDALSANAQLVRATFAATARVPARAQMVTGETGRTLLHLGPARQPGIAEMEWRGDSSAAVRCRSGRRHRTGAEGSALPSVP